MAGPLGSTPGIIVGVAVGSAAAAAIEPAIELPRQEAWGNNPNRILDPGTLARLVAQGGIDLGDAETEAKRDGYAADKVGALVYLAQTVPGFAEALTLWRRNPDSFADLWSHALTKAGLDARYLPFLNQLKDDRLSPPLVALAIVRGIIKDPGFLPVGPPTAEGKVKAFPVSALDALGEAAAFGFDRDRLFVQTAISGRPMGPEAAASAVFRGILERVDFDRAVAEGDIRNEWADAIFESSRFILSPAEWAGLRLRGWKTAEESYEGGAQHGATAETMDDLFLNRGRPATTHQVHIGFARGGRLAAAGNDEKATFTKSIQESDIRPEWTDILWAGRYTMPSAFVLRALVADGTFTAAQGEEILLESGWRPDLAHLAATKWAQGTGAAAKDLTRTELADEYVLGFIEEGEYREHLTTLGLVGHEQDLEVLHAEAAAIKAERNRAVTDIHAKFKKGEIDAARATQVLTELGMHEVAVDRAVSYWTISRDA